MVRKEDASDLNNLHIITRPKDTGITSQKKSYDYVHFITNSVIKYGMLVGISFIEARISFIEAVPI